MDIDDEATDAIRELINIGVGRAAGLLSDMTQRKILLRVPSIRIIRHADLAQVTGSFPSEALSTITLSFQGPLSGLSALVFPPKSAVSLVMLLTGEGAQSAELDAIRVGTLKEVGNIIINAVMGSIANVLGHHLVYSLPAYQEITLNGLANKHKNRPEDWILLANADFCIEKTDIEGNILLVLEVGSMDSLLASIRRVSGKGEMG
jgi:chemotaxis protein CheC